MYTGRTAIITDRLGFRRREMMDAGNERTPVNKKSIKTITYDLSLAPSCASARRR